MTRLARLLAVLATLSLVAAACSVPFGPGSDENSGPVSSLPEPVAREEPSELDAVDDEMDQLASRTSTPPPTFALPSAFAEGTACHAAARSIEAVVQFESVRPGADPSEVELLFAELVLSFTALVETAPDVIGPSALVVGATYVRLGEIWGRFGYDFDLLLADPTVPDELRLLLTPEFRAADVAIRDWFATCS